MLFASVLALPAPALARSVEVVANVQQATAALLPEGAQQWTVCSDCAPGVGSVSVADPVVELQGAAVTVRGRVRADVSMLGLVSGDVICTGMPLLVPGGQVKVGAPTCRLERFGEGLGWSSALASRVAPTLAALLTESLRQLPALELLQHARGGALGAYSADPALQAPKAAECVQSIRSVSVRAPSALAVDVEVSCP